MIRFRRLRPDHRGSVSLEFALIFPILIFLGVGSLELGLMMMTDASLEMGIRAASRAGIITTNATEAQREAKIKKVILGVMTPWIPDEDNIQLKTYVYKNLAEIGKPTWVDTNGNDSCDPGEGTCGAEGGTRLIPGAGTTGSLVLYEVTASRPGFSGVLTMMGINRLTFSRQTVVLNE